MLAACEELNIGFIPWSHLGAGFLNGTITADTQIEATDFRSTVPRFSPEARLANMALVDVLKQLALDKNASPAQLALAWLLAQKPWIVPIRGTTKLHPLEENLGAVNIMLNEQDLQAINRIVASIPVQGQRLHPAGLGLVDSLCRERYLFGWASIIGAHFIDH